MFIWHTSNVPRFYRIQSQQRSQQYRKPSTVHFSVMSLAKLNQVLNFAFFRQPYISIMTKIVTYKIQQPKCNFIRLNIDIFHVIGKMIFFQYTQRFPIKNILRFATRTLFCSVILCIFLKHIDSNSFVSGTYISIGNTEKDSSSGTSETL